MVSFNYAALRAAREKKGFTLAQLAEMAGCKEDFLRDIESGKEEDPPFMLVYRLCCYLGIQVESLKKITPDGEKP